MFSIKRAFVVLASIICVSDFAHARQSSEVRLAAVRVIALAWACTEAHPGVDGDIEKLMADDPSIGEPTKAEVRKIYKDPRYRLQIASMAYTVEVSPDVHKLPELCKNFARQ